MAGLRIGMVIGHGSVRGDGRGLTTRLGASRLTTMDAGSTSVTGLGCPDRCTYARCTRRPWWHGLAAITLQSESRPAVDTAGARWVTASLTFRGTAEAVATSRESTLPTHTSPTLRT